MPTVSPTTVAKGSFKSRLQRPTGNCLLNGAFCLSEEEWKNVKEGCGFDLVVVGSGFCGYAVAERALKNSPTCKVLLIERGQFFLPTHFQNLSFPFRHVVGDASEIFPWTLSAMTASGQGGSITWVHGAVPFFGGKSTLWSAWCPTPTSSEMHEWPKETQDAVTFNIENAKQLLSVRPIDEVDELKRDSLLGNLNVQQPVFNTLQDSLQFSLQDAKHSVPGIYRVEAAPLASAARESSGIDFEKFSVPGELLQLWARYGPNQGDGSENRFSIVTDCTVEKILHEEGRAIALQTSRGTLHLSNADLVLSMGTLPPTTLVANSFPALSEKVGRRFSGHFITSITAQVPVEYLRVSHPPFNPLELAACYIGGIANGTYEQQFHIQLSAVWDESPAQHAEKALRYMPDVVATATVEQLQQSKGCVVFVCAVLGELEADNEDSWFVKNIRDPSLVTNSLLQVVTNQTDAATWDFMDEATFQILENVLCTDSTQVKYWHETSSSRGFTSVRPSLEERRVSGIVHESSTMHVGTGSDALVDTNYRLQGTQNVYVTGGPLWPRGGSWNPTLAMVALSQDLVNKLIPRSSGTA